MGEKGLTTTLIAGLTGIVLLVIISLIVLSTLNDAELLQTETLTTIQQDNMCINTTGLTTACGLLNQFDGRNKDFSVTLIVNDTGMGAASITNYTLLSTGRLKNTTKTSYDSVNVTYKYREVTDYERTTTGLQENLTTGMDNVSVKIPTILLVAAVVLLLGALVYLVAKSREMTSASGLGVSRSAGSSLGEGSQL